MGIPSLDASLREGHVRTLVAMVKSAIDRVERAELVELFTALESTTPEGTRLADAVTFWRHQLMVGVEHSQLAELLMVLDEAAELTDTDSDLRMRAAKWRAVLEPRVQLVEPWRAPLDRH